MVTEEKLALDSFVVHDANACRKLEKQFKEAAAGDVAGFDYIIVGVAAVIIGW